MIESTQAGYRLLLPPSVQDRLRAQVNIQRAATGHRCDLSPSRRRRKIQRLLRRLTKRKLNRFYRATFFQRLPLDFKI